MIGLLEPIFISARKEHENAKGLSLLIPSLNLSENSKGNLKYLLPDIGEFIITCHENIPISSQCVTGTLEPIFKGRQQMGINICYALLLGLIPVSRCVKRQ